MTRIVQTLQKVEIAYNNLVILTLYKDVDVVSKFIIKNMIVKRQHSVILHEIKFWSFDNNISVGYFNNSFANAIKINVPN